ncbi:hypothetical protein ACOTFQ_27650 [Achromobacter xylosoxidans]
MSLKTELTAKTDVVDEAGIRHVLKTYQSFIEVRSFDGIEWVPGLRSHQLDGKLVKMIDGQTFEVVATGVRLRRI